MDSPSVSAAAAAASIPLISESTDDPRLLHPLLNLSILQQRVDSIQQFLYENVQRNNFIGRDEMDLVSNEIVSAIQQVILNGIALLASCSQQQQQEEEEGPMTLEDDHVKKPPPPPPPPPLPEVAAAAFIDDYYSIGKKKKRSVKDEMIDDGDGEGDYKIVELDAVELLAVNIHRCEICGKGFKRDANLRMHKRAHGNQFKTLEALISRPEYHRSSSKDDERAAGYHHHHQRKTRFSCPFIGCNRNKLHSGGFKPLKSAICLKNHFKRSHCPKLFSCNRCNKKSFSVVADLKTHQKHCGINKLKWRCSCGSTFPRKDKLFSHMALFEEDHHHIPAFVVAEEKDAHHEYSFKGAKRMKRTTESREAEEEDDEVKPNPNYSTDDRMQLLDGMLQLESSLGGRCLSSINNTLSSGVSDSISGMDEFQGIWWSGP